MNPMASMTSAFATMHAGVPYSPQARNRVAFLNGGGRASTANDDPHGKGVSKTAGEAWKAYLISIDNGNTSGKEVSTASVKRGP